MTLIAMKKIVASDNIRSFEGIDDFIGTPLEDFPEEDRVEIEQLAETIRSSCLINPITVKDLGGGDRYRIIAGHRRFKAMQYLGMTQIDAKSVKGRADQEPFIALVENIQRRDMNPMDIARALDKIRVMNGLSQTDLAKKISRSPSWVSQYLSLLEADQGVKAAVEGGELGMNAARTIASMPVEEQAGALDAAKKESKAAGKPRVTAKAARRQSTRSSRKKKGENQGKIRPIQERESEQRDDCIRRFIDLQWGEEKPPENVPSIVRMFWEFLLEDKRLVIKP